MQQFGLINSVPYHLSMNNSLTHNVIFYISFGVQLAAGQQDVNSISNNNIEFFYGKNSINMNHFYIDYMGMNYSSLFINLTINCYEFYRSE